MLSYVDLPYIFQSIVKINESRYKQYWGKPTLFHRAKSIEKKKYLQKINIDIIN